MLPLTGDHSEKIIWLRVVAYGFERECIALDDIALEDVFDGIRHSFLALF